MLPIIFCAVQPEDRKVLLASLDEMAQNGKEKVSVETVTDSPEDAARELDEYEKISAFCIKGRGVRAPLPFKLVILLL